MDMVPVQIHFIDAGSNDVVCKKLLSYVPRVSDEVRFGGEGKETFYKVVHICWCYDEPNHWERVNVGIIPIQ